MSADRLAAALAGRYAIERELGAGGMATVYLAHDVRHDRKVALKVLRPELSAILGAERFLAEIKTTANLQHPHILSLFDSGEADGLVYYVMPYVEGESLRDRLAREKQLPVEEAVRVAREVADALEYAHEHGVIHRDIKPENILLHGGHAMVADFGIALAASRTGGGTRLTETGMSLGTPAYMAPEQAMGEREIMPAADVYALGCVLYEMLAGEPPFTGPTAQAIMAQVLTEAPRSIALQRHTVPSHVEAAVHRALERLPADRFASAAQFADALAADSSRARLAVPARPVRAAGRWIRDWRSWTATGVAAMAVLAMILRGRGPAPAAPVARFSMVLPGEPTPAYSEFLSAPAITPDGTILVYEALGRDSSGTTRRELFARRLDQVEPVPIPGTEGARAPFFSPDGRWIGFWVGDRLVKMPVTGGTPITLADSTHPFIRAASWGPDGTIAFPISDNALAEVDEAGGKPKVIYQDSTGIVGDPTVLPDGKSVLFLRCRIDACGQQQEIAVIDGAAHAVRVLTGPGVYRMAQYLPSGYLLYVRGDLIVHADADLVAARFDLRSGITGDGTPVVEHVQTFALSRSGTLVTLGSTASRNTLVTVGVDGTERRLAEDPREYLFPAVSPRGRRVAVEIHDAAGGQIWVYDTASKTLTRLTTQGHNTSPVWSPDGSRIAYASMREPAAGIYVVPADGSAQEQRVGRASPGIAFSHLSWSPDGRRIAYEFSEQNGTTIYTVAAAADSAGRLVPGLQSGADDPAFAPDGRWLAYVSSESGRREVYVRPYPAPAGRWVVSVRGGDDPRWGPSGHTLFYRGADGWLYAATLAFGPGVQITGRARLFDTGPYLADAAYGVFPDGRHFVFVREDRTPPTVEVTLNWYAELDRRLQSRGKS